MCGIKETNLKLQQSLLGANEKNITKTIKEFKELIKNNGIPKITTDRDIIRKAIAKIECFNKSRNKQVITVDVLLPALEDTMMLIQYALKSMRRLTPSDLQLKGRFKKLENKFLCKKVEIEAAYQKRTEVLQEGAAV